MPKRSDRQQLIHEVVDVLAVAAVEEEDDAMLDLADDSKTEEQLQLVQSSRYLVPRQRAEVCTLFLPDVFLYSIPESRFRDKTRMHRSSFTRIVREMEDNPIFHNNSYCPQAPVWMQLAVALDRFAHNGTSSQRLGL
ncbi:hypothetical protein V7S43_014667 [Phytophthora oleae]|uniref:PiggyBac transposable element-derived protein domain-containing protein n=1 Tax=Phytophthora oleae TaxID=2107226 RepID=A0ABD3F140_9STRA